MGNAMEKKSMNINPTQKAGMEKPARAKKLHSASTQVFCFKAARAPRGRPITTEKTMLKNASVNVAGKLTAISSITGVFVLIDSPKSPLKAFVIKEKYCSGKGRSKPSLTLKAAILPALHPAPS